MIETFVNMEWIRKALLIIGSLLLILTIVDLIYKRKLERDLKKESNLLQRKLEELKELEKLKAELRKVNIDAQELVNKINEKNSNEKLQ